jgi:hypothetical protein
VEQDKGNLRLVYWKALRKLMGKEGWSNKNLPDWGDPEDHNKHYETGKITTGSEWGLSEDNVYLNDMAPLSDEKVMDVWVGCYDGKLKKWRLTTKEEHLKLPVMRPYDAPIWFNQKITLPIIKQSMKNISTDITGVQPMSSPSGIVYAVKSRYNK